MVGGRRLELVGFGGLQQVNALLGIPAGLDVPAILPSAIPSTGSGKKPRKPLRAIAHRERYGQPFA